MKVICFFNVLPLMLKTARLYLLLPDNGSLFDFQGRKNFQQKQTYALATAKFKENIQFPPILSNQISISVQKVILLAHKNKFTNNLTATMETIQTMILHSTIAFQTCTPQKTIKVKTFKQAESHKDINVCPVVILEELKGVFASQNKP